MNLNPLAAFGISQDNKQGMRNPWVLGMIALLLLVVVINVGFITMAMRSNPGLVDEKYYERGRDHEQNVLKERAARSALGLETRLDVPDQVAMGRSTTFYFTAMDKLGLPFSGADIQIRAYRPADASADFSVQMHDNGDGRYQAEMAFPLKGTWDLIVKVKRGENEYELTRRISVHHT